MGRRNAAGRIEHGGFWREAEDWPLPGTAWTRFHLHGDRSLGEAEPAAGAKPLIFSADPRNPVPTRGGARLSGEPVMAAARMTRAPSASRPDARRCDPFMTAPLAEPFEIAGPVELRLWVAADGPDSDIHAKLIDLYPPTADDPQGFAMNLCEGVLRLRYRDSWERPTPLVPGTVYAAAVRLFPVANLFMPGHRLRLDIAGSNFPHFDVNPNSGAAEGSMAGARIAHTRVFADRARPSHLVLPVIPRRRESRWNGPLRRRGEDEVGDAVWMGGVGLVGGGDRRGGGGCGAA